MEFCKNEPVLSMGDFNTMPTANALQFLKKERPSKSRLELSFLNEPEITLTNQNEIFKSINHKELEKFEFRNSYGAYQKATGQNDDDDEEGFPEFTNFTRNFKGTLDHIFYSKEFK